MAINSRDNLNYYNKLMIISHPDDEIFWGLDCLLNEKSWKVICITNGNNKLRKNRFTKVLKRLKAEYEIWNFKDHYRWPFSPNEKREIISKLKVEINNPKIEKIVTHNPLGEYGHITHIQISKMVSEILKDQKKLYFFQFDKNNNSRYTLEKDKLILNYFPKYRKRKLLKIAKKLNIKINDINNFTFLDRFSKIINFLITKLISYCSKFFSKIMRNFKFDEDYVFYLHYLASRYYSITKAISFKTEVLDLKQIYGYKYLPRNATEVYFKNKYVYDKYLDRKFIITDFLPKAIGKTLSVGCHYINQFDCYCVPNPQEYKTLDLHKGNEVFGSPYGHETIDFLDYQPNYLFSNIILFGVLGIKTIDIENKYTLFKNEKATIDHIDNLLTIKGKVLLGPDIFIDKKNKREEKIEYWKNFFNTNDTLNSKYKLINYFEFSRNLIYIYEKII